MGIFKPEVGDTVEAWSDEAELWEPGTVLAYGADRRLYFIQPDDEDLPEFLIGYTGIRPVSEQRTKGRMSALEFELDYWKNRAEVTHLQHVAANKRADDEESRADRLADMLNTTIDERDAMKSALDEYIKQLADEIRVSKNFEAEFNNAEARIEELEGELEAVRTMSRGLVEELDETGERAEKAEADLSNLRAKVIELRKTTLSEMTRIAAEDGTADTVDEFPENTRVPVAVIDGMGTRWELNSGTGMYEVRTCSRTLGHIEAVYRIAERIY